MLLRKLVLAEEAEEEEAIREQAAVELRVKATQVPTITGKVVEQDKAELLPPPPAKVFKSISTERQLITLAEVQIHSLQAGRWAAVALAIGHKMETKPQTESPIPAAAAALDGQVFPLQAKAAARAS